MRLVLHIFCFTLLLFSIVACDDDESMLENKWQLRRFEQPDGSSEMVDSVFYNFMKGSFSAICLLPDKSVQTLYGNYMLDGKELFIKLREGDDSGVIFEKYFNWEKGRRLFIVDELTSSSLCLDYRGMTSVFRKY